MSEERKDRREDEQCREKWEVMKQCLDRAFLKGYNVNLRSASNAHPQL